MPAIRFEPRYQHDRFDKQPDLATLREYILSQGSVFGDALIHRLDDASNAPHLILLVDRNLGIYIKYIDGDNQWLSLHDRTRLSEVVCPDDWNAPAGLFVPTETAWLAIEEFCKTGRRSKAIEWTTPAEIPEDGNW
ncbi:MAG: Imm1 family immunity protein [Planctomycetota bacterium]|jgi:hypothetical protein